MKKQFNLALLCLLILFSCSQDISIEPLSEPHFKTDLPAFPLAYLYIVVREYEHLKLDNDFKYSKEDYIEKRLMELFPTKAYKGIYNNAMTEANHFVKDYNAYSETTISYNESFDILDSTFIDEEYYPFVSFEDEINYLNLSQEEIQSFSVLDKIAFSNLNKSQFDSAFSVTNRFWINEISFVAFTIPLAFVVKYSVFRIMQSKIRADAKAEYYFPNNKEYDSKRDAFRHIFVSMHLRRYLGRTGSAMIMSAHEYFNPNSNIRDKHMDLHNNIVGRAAKYWTFRGGYFKNRFDWEKWAKKIKNYVDNEKNGVDMDWEDNHQANYKKDVEKVSKKKYVYY